MAIIAYARVSRFDQTVEGQLLEIQNVGYTLDPELIFSDYGVSGKELASNRPGFAMLLLKARRGDVLVVQKLDRLGRNAMDVVQTVKRLDEAGVKVVCLNLGSTDLTSMAGKLMLTMLAAVAEMERDLIVERTKAGIAAAQARGVVCGGRRENRHAKQIARRAMAGESPSRLAREFGITRQTVYLMVKKAKAEAEAKQAGKSPA